MRVVPLLSDLARRGLVPVRLGEHSGHRQGRQHCRTRRCYDDTLDPRPKECVNFPYRDG